MTQEIDIWRPWRGLRPWREMEGRMDRLFEEMLGRTPRQAPGPAEMVPAIEMFEREGTIVVRADLPGIKREDISVEATDHTLVISGERKAESEIKDKDYYRCERSYGMFRRAIELPEGIDRGAIQAQYADGVIEVTIPKAKGAEPQKIEVQ